MNSLSLLTLKCLLINYSFPSTCLRVWNLLSPLLHYYSFIFLYYLCSSQCFLHKNSIICIFFRVFQSFNNHSVTLNIIAPYLTIVLSLAIFLAPKSEHPCSSQPPVAVISPLSYLHTPVTSPQHLHLHLEAQVDRDFSFKLVTPVDRQTNEEKVH